MNGLRNIVFYIQNARSDILYALRTVMERQNIERVFDSMEDMNYIENYTYKIGFLEQPEWKNQQRRHQNQKRV
jgi:histidinol phosphatase-like enzyme